MMMMCVVDRCCWLLGVMHSNDAALLFAFVAFGSFFGFGTAGSAAALSTSHVEVVSK
jgi:hypothetical protein